MKRLMISLIVIFVFFTISVEATPGYEKWGKIAVEKTRERYNADIIDYRHIGRNDLTPKKAEEKFILWLKSKSGNEFGVIVLIQFDPSTEMIQSIQFSEAQ